MSFKKIALGGAAVSMALGSVAHASVIDNPFFKVLGTVVVWTGNSSGDAVVHDFIINTSAGNGDADLIAADGNAVVTGTLLPFVDSGNGVYDADGDEVLDTGITLDVSDSIDGQVGTYKSSFHVASNTVFNIEAEANNFVATGDFNEDPDGLLTTAQFDAAHADNIVLAMEVTGSGSYGSGATALNFGGNAQDPSSGDATAFQGFEAGLPLTGLLTKSDVFQGAQRTAAAAGSIASQSVRFDATYTLQSNDDGTGNTAPYDMSMGAGSLQAQVTYTVYVP